MTDLPPGWRWVILDDLQADEPRAITDGPFGSNLTSAHYTSGGPRVVRLQNIGDGEFVDARAHISEEHFATLRAHEVHPGDLLIASLGQDPPRACLAPPALGPAIVKADCIRVRLGTSVEPRWVLYALQTSAAKRWASEKMYGVGRPRLGLKTIRAIPLPLPPLADQRRIIETLDDHLSRLDAANGGLKRSARLMRTMTESVVTSSLTAAAVPGIAAGLDDVGADDGRLPSLPARWRWRRLHEIADVASGVAKNSKQQSSAALVDVPYLRVANVQRGRLDLSSLASIRVPAATADRLRLQPGDVLLNEGGDRDKLGRGWVWEGQVENCIHQNHVFRARVRDSLLDPYLLSWAANSIGGRWCERNGRQTVNLANISLSKIRLMPVPVPPKDAQPAISERIRAALQAAQRMEHDLAHAHRRSAALRRALLTAAIAGRLTNRPQATDEIVEDLAHV